MRALKKDMALVKLLSIDAVHCTALSQLRPSVYRQSWLGPMDSVFVSMSPRILVDQRVSFMLNIAS